ILGQDPRGPPEPNRAHALELSPDSHAVPCRGGRQGGQQRQPPHIQTVTLATPSVKRYTHITIFLVPVDGDTRSATHRGGSGWQPRMSPSAYRSATLSATTFDSVCSASADRSRSSDRWNASSWATRSG